MRNTALSFSPARHILLLLSETESNSSADKAENRSFLPRGSVRLFLPTAPIDLVTFLDSIQPSARFEFYVWL